MAISNLSTSEKLVEDFQKTQLTEDCSEIIKQEAIIPKKSDEKRLILNFTSYRTIFILMALTVLPIFHNYLLELLKIAEWKRIPWLVCEMLPYFHLVFILIGSITDLRRLPKLLRYAFYATIPFLAVFLITDTYIEGLKLLKLYYFNLRRIGSESEV